MFSVNKRVVGLLVLVLVVVFYAIGTGFPFFYRLLYVVLFLIAVGGGWALLSLRGLEVRVSRAGDRGKVGEYLEGTVTVTNRTWLPKSWLEVTEVDGASPMPGGRGLSLDRRQVRSWRIDTYLARRGLFQGGRVRVVSQDPFGLFRMGRRFSDPHTYIVYPAAEPLPNLDSRFAGLPADSRLTRYFDQVTTDVASLRAWRPGDAYRRIHWPYTARMNSPMVKEFDSGLAAQFWLLLDLHRPSHYYPTAREVASFDRLRMNDGAGRGANDGGGRGANGGGGRGANDGAGRRGNDGGGRGGNDGVGRGGNSSGGRGGNGGVGVRGDDNTEELAVTVAASLAQRLMELGLPVGLAVNGESGGLLRPDNGPDHLNRIMEMLAGAQADNAAPLSEFIYGMRPHLNHFHSVTVITANTDPGWIAALLDLKRLNVTVSAALVDPASYGGRRTAREAVDAAAAELMPVYVAGRGGHPPYTTLDAALARPVNRESLEGAEDAALTAGAGPPPGADAV